MAGGVAILGAGGFVGARFVELAVLDGRSDEVIPIVRAAKSVARTAHLGLTYRFGDASRPDSLARALEGCEAVVDLTKGNPADMPRIAESVHAAALAARVRVLVHLSSATVYGQLERPDLADDALPRLDHWMRYAREKGRAENFLRERMGDGRLTTVVLRPGLIWGPGSPYVLGSGSDLVRGAAYLVGDGGGICNLMYVDNLVRSIAAVVGHPAPASGFYNVADDETTTWREFYGGLAAGLGVDPATIHLVPGGRYRAGLRDLRRDVQELAAYVWLKGRLSVEARAEVKRRLARALGRDLPDAPDRRGRPVVTREMHDLQTTRHRLPTAKFRATFGHQNTTSFVAGMASSLAWLRFIGVDAREEAVPAPVARPTDVPPTPAGATI